MALSSFHFYVVRQLSIVRFPYIYYVMYSADLSCCETKSLWCFVPRIMSVLGVDGTPEDKELTLRYKYFLLMGRKP